MWHSAENKFPQNSELPWQWWRDWNRWKFSTFTCCTTAHLYCARYNTKQKLHDSCNVPSDQFNLLFRLQCGSPTHVHKPAGDAHHFILFHVQPANQQPTITSADLCHKNVGRPWFTETRVTQFQPFLVLHNARFHSEYYTNDKGSNQKCQNNNIPPRNTQYLKIHVRN